MAFVNIGNQITSILTANITTAKDISNYAKRNPTGYPAITVEAHDGNGKFADTGRNRREYVFRVLIMQERVKVTASEAERIMRVLFDQVISTFDNRTNITLNNSCDFAYPVPSKWGYIQAPDVDVRTAEVMIVATVLS